MNKDNNTPLHLAVQNGRTFIVQLIETKLSKR